VGCGMKSVFWRGRELADVTARYRETLDKVTMFEGELRAWTSKSTGDAFSESNSFKVLQRLITSQQEAVQRCSDLQDAIRHIEKELSSTQGSFESMKVTSVLVVYRAAVGIAKRIPV
jgi:hypothetical protein